MKILTHFFVILFSLGITGNVCANVVMAGTRIIYPGNIKEKTIQLRNTSKQPFIVNIQVDDGSDIDKKKHAHVPFITTPQIFRMEGATGQSVKLIFTGETLPQDRESVFYFSFSQLPYMENTDKSENRLILALTNRLKIFYRPENIPGKSNETAEKLIFHIKPHSVEVNNPTGYYSVIRSAELVANGKKYPLADSVMVPPKSKAEWPLRATTGTMDHAMINLVTVNDYGVNVRSEHSL